MARIEELLPLVTEDTPEDDANFIELVLLSNRVADYDEAHYPVNLNTPYELFGAKVGKGWVPLIEPIIERVRELNKAGANVKISQIKEKWGSLTIYFDSAPEELWEMAHEAAEKSMMICEHCGAPATLTEVNGWLYTRCPDCLEKLRRHNLSKSKNIMIEYTTFYLRYKATPVLEYKNYPSYEEVINLSESERKNDHVSESWGAELLCLSITQSRELSIIPCAESPKVVTLDLLKRIISFNKEEIDECHKYIDLYKKRLAIDERLAKEYQIYDKISSEIKACQDSLKALNKDLEKHQYHRCKFEFLMDIFKNLNEDYELIYTKC
jgi:hypothetical protein